MRARRFFLLAGIAASAMMSALSVGNSAAVAASPSDMGGWGQAWGDDTVPETPAPAPRARTPLPAPAPVSSTPVVRSEPLPAGPSASEIGGWGNAWGDDGAAPATVPARPRAAAQTAVPAGNALPPQQQAPVSTAPAPRSPAAETSPPASPSRIQVAAPAGALKTMAGKDQPDEQDDSADTETPVSLTADQIVYDRELGIVSAKGRVEIVQESRMLVADQVSYNLKQDIVSANGNVTLAEPGGETLFTNYMELTGDLKEGVASEIRAILADNSRMGAASAHRVAGNRTDFDKGTYTACEPCRKNPDKTPLWQAKAERITHNQDERIIEYRDAWLELGGVPVMYTPYLSHPDPSVRRQSGFLTPIAGMSSNIGTNVTVPYFWAIKDNQDITFMPRFLFPGASTKNTATDVVENDDVLRHMVLAGEHRWRGALGEERTFASLTADRHTGDLRGHIDSRANFDLDSNWRAGYQLERSSDDTYTAVYSYRIDAQRPWLITRPYVEGFGRRGYTVAEGFSYQGLRATDDPGKSPIVLPHVMSNQMTSPDSKGGYYTFDSDVLAYSRDEGVSAARLSQTAGWHRPYYGSLGDVTTISTSLRADGFHADSVPTVGSANAGRVVPTVAAQWRMPFVRPSTVMPQLIEPVAMVAASPLGGNSEKIPNEDSVGFELDETNVFRPNRLPGLDRVEGGMRGAYGLRWQAYPGNTGRIMATIAQGWRARADTTFSPGSGFDESFSDYLARLDIVPSPYLAFYNRARIDKNHGDLRRSENTLSAGSPLARANFTYIMLDRVDDPVDPFARQHYAAWSMTSALTRHWALTGGVTYDLTDMGGPIGWNSKLTYDDECLGFGTTVNKNYTYDRDFLPGYTVTLTLVLKTLGSVPFNVF